MVGQIYYYNPFISEKYYLYLLLISISNLKSYEDLRSIDNYLSSIF